MRGTEIDFSRFTLRGDLPPHRQIAAYLKTLVALGELEPGRAVPGVPALAYRLKVPHGEVRIAYDELSQRGFLAARSGGWIVSGEHSAVRGARAAEEIGGRLWELLVEARQAGLTPGELRRMFDRLLPRS